MQAVMPQQQHTANGDNHEVGRSAAAAPDEDVQQQQDLKATNGSLFPPLRATSAAVDGNSSCEMQQQPPPVGASDNLMFVQHRMVPIPQSSYNILRARRGVIRMLIVVVLTFALCNLPFHARKIWQYW